MFEKLNSILHTLGGFESQPHVAVAVSGGPDSIALVHGLKKWQQGHVTALIVDHQLRSHSTHEAQHVASILKNQGIKAHILTWASPKPTSRIQETARAMRYNLLTQWCHKEGILHLFLAHHANDQEETRLMRLMKGSHLQGLQGMSPVLYQPFGRLIRPCLAFTKQDLITYCHENNLSYVTDPSNISPLYLRTYLRNLLKQHPNLYKVPQHTLAKTLKAWTGRYVWRHGHTFRENHKIKVVCQQVLNLPPFFQETLIYFLVQAWGASKAYPPRYSSLQKVRHCFVEGKKAYLQGVTILRHQNDLILKADMG